jgi:hypothetical protein
MAGLSGKTQTILNKGRVDRRYIDLLGAGVSGDLLPLLNPLKQQAANVELNCFVNAFDIKNGLAKSTALALDTGYLRVVGEGTVNLKTEELDFAFIPAPKASLKTKGGADLDLGNLSIPLRLTGTLAQPTLGVSAGGTALAVEKMIGGKLAGLAGSISGAGEKSEEDFCLAAVETAKQGGKAASPRKEKGAVERTPGGVKEATDQAKDTFKKLFGK